MFVFDQHQTVNDLAVLKDNDREVFESTKKTKSPACISNEYKSQKITKGPWDTYSCSNEKQFHNH